MKRAFIPILLIFLVACSGKSEMDLKSDFKKYISEKKYNEAEKVIDQLIKDYPESKITDSLVFNFAALYQSKMVENLSNEESFKKAIKYYTVIYENYPKSTIAPKSLFITAYLYANELKDLKKAEALYKKFLQEYPNNEFAPSAKVELENLGVPPAEIINKINGSK